MLQQARRKARERMARQPGVASEDRQEAGEGRSICLQGCANSAKRAVQEEVAERMNHGDTEGD